MKKLRIGVFALLFITLLGGASIAYAAEIGNTVWNDANKNGVQDPGEEGISGVKIKLYRGNKIETDKTNSQGRYKFKDIDNGSYDVIVAQETLPEGCVATYDRDGNKDGKYYGKYVKDDEYYTHMDFGYYCPAKTTYVAKVSPKTGAGSIATIISLAISALFATMVYKKQAKLSRQ
jgi:hypothetical protein